MLQSALKNPLTVACGLSITLVACGDTTPGESTRPTRFLSIQPIQVCNDFGIFCADLALFEEATRKIWSQANIEIDFLDPVRLHETRFLTIETDEEFAELSFSGGAGAFGRHPLSTRTSGPLNMWFVEDIFNGLVDTLGLAWIDQNGVLINDDILDFNNGVGRLDTVAHEIGHNLGLTHSNFGAGPANNLMSDGSVRNVPSTLADITPDGARLDQINPGQIDFARGSSLVTASPGPSASSGATGEPTPTPSLLEALPPVMSPPSADAPPVIESTAGFTEDFPMEADGVVAAPPSTLAVAEADPTVPQVVGVGSILMSLDQAPQKIPNGPAMSVLSAGVLAGFLWRSQKSR